jgi:uncharacterized membrane protein
MALLIAATVLVIASHVVPSAPRMRACLIGAFGRSGFYVAYSLASILTLGLLIWAYRAAGPQEWLYTPAPAARTVALLTMLLATFLLTTRLTTPAPPDHPIGIYRVTAAPGSLGVLLWTLVHLLNLGEARAVVVFAGLAAMTLFALLKNLAVAGPTYRKVGWLPFAAIVSGREIFVGREIGWWRVGLALLVYASLLCLHPIVIGRDPLAGIR